MFIKDTETLAPFGSFWSSSAHQPINWPIGRQTTRIQPSTEPEICPLWKWARATQPPMDLLDYLHIYGEDDKKKRRDNSHDSKQNWPKFNYVVYYLHIPGLVGIVLSHPWWISTSSKAEIDLVVVVYFFFRLLQRCLLLIKSVTNNVKSREQTHWPVPVGWNLENVDHSLQCPDWESKIHNISWNAKWLTKHSQNN